MARQNQDTFELPRSLHGCQKTRSWQDFQERLTMTWQDVPSNKKFNSTQKHELARNHKIKQELSRFIKN